MSSSSSELSVISITDVSALLERVLALVDRSSKLELLLCTMRRARTHACPGLGRQ